MQQVFIFTKKNKKETKINYPHFSKREEELGFSNWMTPSNGTSSPATKTVWSLAKGAEGAEAEVEEEVLVAEPDSMPPSALASVTCKVLLELLVVMNLSIGFDNGSGFAVMNLEGDERERFADMAPKGVWLASIITNVGVNAQCCSLCCALSSTQDDRDIASPPSVVLDNFQVVFTQFF